MVRLVLHPLFANSQEVVGYYQACSQELNFVCRSPPSFAPARRGRGGLRHAL